MTIFSDNHVNKHNRAACALADMMSMPCADTLEASAARRSLSAHVEEVAQQMGLWGASDALRFKDALILTLGTPLCGLMRLTCFLCLQCLGFCEHNV